MATPLNFDGKKFISSKRASELTGYAGDYIGQLCRGGKLDCRMVGRSWYVSEESILSHKKLSVEKQNGFGAKNGNNVPKLIKSKNGAKNGKTAKLAEKPVVEKTQIKEPAPVSKDIEKAEKAVRIEKIEKPAKPSALKIGAKKVFNYDISDFAKRTALSGKVKLANAVAKIPPPHSLITPQSVDVLHKAAAMAFSFALVFGTYAYRAEIYSGAKFAADKIIGAEEVALSAGEKISLAVAKTEVAAVEAVSAPEISAAEFAGEKLSMLPTYLAAGADTVWSSAKSGFEAPKNFARVFASVPSKLFSLASGAASDLIANVGSAGVQIASLSARAVSDFVSGAGDSAGKIISGAASLPSAVGEGFAASGNFVGNSIVSGAMSAGGFVSDKISTAWRMSANTGYELVDIYRFTNDSVEKIAADSARSVYSSLASVPNAISGAVASAPKTAANAMASAPRALSDLAVAAASAPAKIFSFAGSAISDSISGVKNFGAAAISASARGFQNLGNVAVSVSASLADATGGIAESVKSVPSALLSFGESAGEAVAKNFIGASDAVQKFAGDTADNSSRIISQGLSFVSNGYFAIGQNFVSASEWTGQTIGKTIINAPAKIAGGIAGAFTGFRNAILAVNLPNFSDISNFARFINFANFKNPPERAEGGSSVRAGFTNSPTLVALATSTPAPTLAAPNFASVSALSFDAGTLLASAGLASSSPQNLFGDTESYFNRAVSEVAMSNAVAQFAREMQSEISQPASLGENGKGNRNGNNNLNAPPASQLAAVSVAAKPAGNAPPSAPIFTVAYNGITGTLYSANQSLKSAGDTIASAARSAATVVGNAGYSIYSMIAGLFGNATGNSFAKNYVPPSASAPSKTPPVKVAKVPAAQIAQPAPAKTGAPVSGSGSRTTPPTIIERYITQTPPLAPLTAVIPSYSKSEVDLLLQQLNNKLSSQIYQTSAAQSVSTGQVYNVISQTNKIDQLTNTALTNPTITGGSISGASFAGTSGSFSSGLSTGGALSVGGTVAVSGAGTSTFSNGITLTSGCFQLPDGTCAGGGSGGVGAATLAGQIPFYNVVGTQITATSSIFISQNGNFGIGTTSPSDVLAVNGATYLAPISAPSVVTDRLYNIAGTLYWKGIDLSSGLAGNWSAASGNVYRTTGTVGVGTTTAWGALSVDTTGIAIPSFVVGSSAGTKFIVANGGNVGVGTTSPFTNLSVAGSGSFDNFVRASYFSATSTTATSTFSGLFDISRNLVVGGFVSASTFNATSTTATSTFAGGLSGVFANFANGLIVSGGNFGIGTTSPSSLLSVQGNALISGNLTLANLTATGTVTFSGQGANMFAAFNGSNQLVSSSTPTAAAYFATSTTAASIFPLFTFTSATGTILTMSSTTIGQLITGVLSATSTTATSTFAGLLDVFRNGVFGGFLSASTFNATSTTATSTFAGGLNVLAINQTGSATSTFSGGITLSSGCFKGPDGNCITNGVAVLSGGANKSITFWTGADAVSSNPNFVWDNINGLMGIGTTSPYSMLSVAGQVVGQNFVATSTIATSTFAGLFDISRNLVVGGFASASSFNATSTMATSTFAGGFTAGNNAGLSVNYAAPANSLYINPSGNVGVGTSSPGVKFQVAGQSGTGNIGVMNITGYDSFGQSLVMQLPGTGYTGNLIALMKAYGGSGQAMGFSTHFTNDAVDRFSVMNHSGAENLSVLDTGNVGAGSTTPAAKLAIDQGSATTIGQYIAGFYNSTADIFRISTSTPTATSTAFVIDSNGRLGIGTTSPYQQLSVAGNILASGNINTKSLTISGITGIASNCLRADANGVISGMGADCGTAGGEANTGASLGTGINIFDSKSGVQLRFNTLSAGTNISLSTTTNDNTIVINSTATSGGLGWASTTVPNSDSIYSLQIGNVGIGTSSPYSMLSVAGQIVGQNFVATSTTATSTFAGLFDISRNLVVGGFASASTFNATSTTATSTFAGGLSTAGLSSSNGLTITGGSLLNNSVSTSTFSGGLNISGGGLTVGNSSGLALLTNGALTATANNSSNWDSAYTKRVDTWTSPLKLTGNTASFDFSVANTWTGLQTFNGDLTSINATSSRMFYANQAYIASSSIGYLTLGSIFATSSLNNYFGGNVGIGTTSPWANLSISATTTAQTTPLFAISTSTTGYPTGFVIDQNGKVGIGTTTPSGTNALSVQDSSYFAGNVGVGTAAPAYKLDVNGNARVSGGTIYGDTANPYLTLTDAGGSKLNYGANTSMTVGNGQIFWTTNSTTRLKINSSGNIGISTTTPLAMLDIANTLGSQTDLFNISSTTATNVVSSLFRIQANGNVGIATTSPYSMLSVAGQVVGQNFMATSTTATSTFSGGFTAGNNAGLTVNQIAPANSLVVSSNGSVGVGKANPSSTYALDINGNVNASTYYVGSNTYLSGNTVSLFNSTAVTFQNGSNASGSSLQLVGGAAANSYLRLLPNSSTEAMRIVSSGNVGIGTTTPNWLLQVASTTLSSTMTGQFALTDFGAGANLKHWIFSSEGGNFYLGTSSDAYSTSTVPAISILGSNSFVGIGTTSPSQALSIAGNLLVGTGINSTLNWNVGLAKWFNPATTTIQDNQASSWEIATTTNGVPIISIQTVAGQKATTTINSGLTVDGGNLNYDYSSGITSVGSLSTGNLNFDTDAGVVGWVDLPVGANSSAFSPQSYSASIASNPILTIYAQANGSSGIFATSTGVGIGTTTPSSMLEILAGSTTPFTTGFMANYNGVAIYNQATSSTASVTKTGLNIQSTGAWSGTSASNIGLYVSSVTGGTNNYDAIFNGGGNVGVGTTSPYSMLSVAGQIVGQNFVATSTTATSTFTGATFSGIVGIGTTSPQGLLDISGASSGTDLTVFVGGRALSIINTDTTANNASGLDFRTMDANGLITTAAKIMGVYTSHTASAVSADLAFLTRNSGTISEKTRLTAAGNFGIGTTTPAAKLSVDQGSATTIGQYIAGFYNSTADLFRISTSTATATSTAIVVNSNGMLGIGTSSPYAPLSVSGNGVFTGNVDIQGAGTTTFAGDINVSGFADLTSSIQGNQVFDADAGAFSWIDLPIVNATNGSVESYTANIAGNPLMTLYSQSNGAGNISPTTFGIGIGTTSPLAMLDVMAGSTTVSTTGFSANYNAVNINNLATSSTASITKAGLNIQSTGAWNGASASNIGLYVSSVTGGTNNYDAIFNGGGNVGIGTTSPYSMLSVAGQVVGQNFMATSTTATSTFSGGLSGAFANFSSGLTVSGGAVGIASTSPWALFSVNGNALGSVPQFVVGSSSATNFIVNNAGFVGIGTTSPSQALSIAGNLLVGTGINSTLNWNVGLAKWFNSATTTIQDNQASSWEIATTTNGVPIISIQTVTGQKATTTINSGLTVDGGNLNYDYSSGITSVGSLATGNLNFDTDAGMVSWADMALSSAPANTLQGYTAFLAGNPMLTIYGLSNGSGNTYATSTGVGIGTTTPSSMLEILAGSSTSITSGFTTNYNGVAIYNQATSSTASVTKTGLNIQSTGAWSGTSASNIGLYVSSVTGGTNNYDAIFNGGGNVGIGTTSPWANLSISATTTAQTVPLFAVSTSTTGYPTGFVIDQNGKVGIGTASPSGTNMLSVQGSSYFNGNIGVGSTTPWGLLSVNPNGISGPAFVVGSSTATYFQVTNGGSILATSTNWFGSSDYAGTGIINFMRANASDTIELGASVLAGGITAEADSGNITLFDMPLTSATANGTLSSASLGIAESPVLTIAGTSDGAGNMLKGFVGVGSTTPGTTFAIGSTTANYINLDETATSTFSGNLYVKGTLRATVSYVGDLIFGNNFSFSELQPIGTTTVQALLLKNQYGSTTLSFDEFGNVGIGTSSSPFLGPLVMNSGAFVTTGGVWTNASSRAVKENFTAIDPNEILGKVLELPMTKWNYKAEATTTAHIGPLAEDFYNLFQLGGSNTSISTVDPAGVALVSVQALSKVLNIATSTSVVNGNTIAALTSVRLDSIESRLSALEASSTSSGVSGAGLLAAVNSAISGIKEWTLDKITVASAYVQSLWANNLTVGSESAPSGITLFDEITKAPYCLKVSGGMATTTPGACSNSPLVKGALPSEAGGISTASSSPSVGLPVITLIGNNPANINIGESFIDPGATAVDGNGASLMPDIFSNNVNTSSAGTYEVIWTAHDSQMNFATSTRTVIVSDPNATATSSPKSDSNTSGSLTSTASSTSATSDTATSTATTTSQ